MAGFTYEVKALRDLIKDLARAVPRHTSLPILENIWVSVGPGAGVRLVSTNLDFAMVRDVFVGEFTEGQLLIPARKLIEVLAAVPADGLVALDGVKVEPEGKAAYWELRVSGAASATLRTADPAEFPPLPPVPDDDCDTLEIDLAEWCADFVRVASACGKDRGRPIYTGVLLSVHDSRVDMVGTDGHRMAVRSYGGDHEFSREAIIPAELAKLLPARPAPGVDLAIGFMGKRMHMTWAGHQIFAILIDGVYPTWQRVFPDTTPWVAVGQQAALLGAARAVAPMARDAARIVRLIPGPGGELIFRTGLPQDGSAEATAQMVYQAGDGLPETFAMNVDYLIDALAHMGPGDVRLGITAPLVPTILRGSDGFSVVIMPVRLPDGYTA